MRLRSGRRDSCHCRINSFGGWQPFLGAVGAESRIDLSANLRHYFIIPQGYEKKG